MKPVMKKLKPHILLLLCILALGGIFRCVGMTHDMTDDGEMAGYWHPNEGGLIRYSLETFRPPLFDHQYWGYPSLHMYLLASLDLIYYGTKQLASFRLQDLCSKNLKEFYADRKAIFYLSTAKQFYLNHETTFYMIARMVSWLAGMATLLLLYRMGVRIFNVRIALSATFLLVCYQQHVEQCHYGTLESLFTLLCLLAVYYSYRAYSTLLWKDILLAGLFVGLATAEKYNAFILGATLIIAFIVSGMHAERIARLKRLLASLGVAVGTFFLVNFYLFIDPGIVIALFQRNFRSVVAREGPAFYFWDGAYEYLLALSDFGLKFAFYLAVPGALLFLVRRPREGCILLSFPLFFFLLMSSFYLRVPYYLLPMIPVLLLFSAYALQQIGSLVRPKRFQLHAFCFLTALAAFPMFIEASQFVNVLGQPDTRQNATKWIKQQIPKGSRVVVEGNREYGPSLSDKNFQLWNRTAQTSYLWDSLAKCRNAGIEYFIVSEEMVQNVEMGWIPSGRIYQELAEDPDVELVKTFKGHNYPQTFMNVTLWVYRIHPREADGSSPPLPQESAWVEQPSGGSLPAMREEDRNGPMIFIPAGTFLMGTAPDDPIREPSQKKLEPTQLAGFWIDKYPYPNQPDEFPMIRVNWFKASETCESSEKRLCTEEEWEKACKGPGNHRYPYGDSFEDKACHLAGDYFHSSFKPIASFRPCVSGYGVFDMSGNINEWTTSTWGKEDIKQYGIRVEKMPLGWRKGRQPFFPILKGGDWGMKAHEVNCASRNHILPPDERTMDVGFRCCMDGGE